MYGIRLQGHETVAVGWRCIPPPPDMGLGCPGVMGEANTLSRDMSGMTGVRTGCSKDSDADRTGNITGTDKGTLLYAWICAGLPRPSSCSEARLSWLARSAVCHEGGLTCACGTKAGAGTCGARLCACFCWDELSCVLVSVL